MDTELKCNRLTCRKSISDKAVVTTCSHIFCVECANELFNAARLCPACETSLTEPDDVVVCSLRPSNDYKTSVLSGLSPSVILEICSRAIAFWQYQVHQENSFQQAVVRNVNDKNSQLQKQLDNVVREANGEISLLSSKLMELERDLEVERRKVRELQDTAREKDKEYQKLKNQYEKIKRKALLGPGPANLEVPHPGFVGPGPGNPEMHPKLRNHGAPVDLEFVVGGMEANGIQRTPLINRTTGNSFVPQHNSGWAQQLAPMQAHARNHSHRQAFGGHEADRSYRSGNTSDRSESANEVEELLLHRNHQPAQAVRTHSTGWSGAPPSNARPSQRAFAQPKRGFRPAGPMMPR